MWFAQIKYYRSEARLKNTLAIICVYLRGLKRAATILFIGLYALASSGILVGQHLCMGRVKSIALFQQVEKKCGTDMQQSMEGCCEDRWHLEKVDDQQGGASYQAPVAEYHLLYDSPFYELEVILTHLSEEVEAYNTGPPDRPEPDLYILFQALKLPADLQS